MGSLGLFRIYIEQLTNDRQSRNCNILVVDRLRIEFGGFGLTTFRHGPTRTAYIEVTHITRQKREKGRERGATISSADIGENETGPI